MASTRALVRPDLLPGLDLFPTVDFNDATIEMARTMIAQLPAPPAPASVVVGGAQTTSADGAKVRIVTYAPNAASERPRPAVLHIHGGGYVIGSPEMMAAANYALVEQVGCFVASVDYRLAPGAKYPAAVEDCYAALRWLHANASALNIDPKRIAVKGESAGGGLAAALALLARDRGDAPICFQALIAPMLDDREAMTTNRYTGEFVWTRASNTFGWSSLLNGPPSGADTPAYAAAARAESLAGLPPAFIDVGALDLFLEQDVAYAMRLLQAGVPTELHVYDGAYHGFEIVADSPLTQQATRDCFAALARAFT